VIKNINAIKKLMHIHKFYEPGLFNIQLNRGYLMIE